MKPGNSRMTSFVLEVALRFAQLENRRTRIVAGKRRSVDLIELIRRRPDPPAIFLMIFNVLKRSNHSIRSANCLDWLTVWQFDF